MSHLSNLRSKNAGNIIFTYLNINSIHNKFDNLGELVAGNTQSAFTCSKLPIETLEQDVKYVLVFLLWRHCGVFIVDFEHISHLVLVFLLLTLKM